MAKEVVLMSDIDGLGVEGDVVEVAEGYARNYLLPRKLAAPATGATMRRVEKIRSERRTRLEQELAGAKEIAGKLENTSCTITVKSGEEGKLYGSVTPADVIDALKGQGIELDRKQLDMSGPIRELGVFDIPVKLHPDIHASLKVWVVEE